MIDGRIGWSRHHGMPIARDVLKAGHRVVAQSLSKYKRL